MDVRVTGDEHPSRTFARFDVSSMGRAMHRIDRALDDGDRQEFARACRQRSQILLALMVEVEASGFVAF